VLIFSGGSTRIEGVTNLQASDFIFGGNTSAPAAAAGNSVVASDPPAPAAASSAAQGNDVHSPGGDTGLMGMYMASTFPPAGALAAANGIGLAGDTASQPQLVSPHA
jgi:hypothetical protein